MRNIDSDDILSLRTEKLRRKISYLRDQLENLDPSMPDTGDYLMSQMDSCRRKMAEIEVQLCFQEIDEELD